MQEKPLSSLQLFLRQLGYVLVPLFLVADSRAGTHGIVVILDTAIGHYRGTGNSGAAAD